MLRDCRPSEPPGPNACGMSSAGAHAQISGRRLGLAWMPLRYLNTADAVRPLPVLIPPSTATLALVASIVVSCAKVDHERQNTWHCWRPGSWARDCFWPLRHLALVVTASSHNVPCDRAGGRIPPGRSPSRCEDRSRQRDAIQEHLLPSALSPCSRVTQSGQVRFRVHRDQSAPLAGHVEPNCRTVIQAPDWRGRARRSASIVHGICKGFVHKISLR